MKTKLQEMKWNIHNYKLNKLLLWGLKNGYIGPYNDTLIKKLRTIYDGGIPASIILLSDGMSNGFCYDRAFLMAKAFLDEDCDVNLLYIAIDSLRLNPHQEVVDNPLYDNHCVVELTFGKNKKFIIDTSTGFIYDKRLYWIIECPKLRKVKNKKEIIKLVEQENFFYPGDIENEKYISPLILPMIECTYNRPNEMYSMLGIELLQREIAYFKETINYEKVCQEIDEDMKRLGLK